MEYLVENNEELKRFEVQVNGKDAFIDYKLYGTDAIALIHTEVPEELEGKGIASTLAHYALEFARTNGLKVKVYCSFIKLYMERHKEYSDLVK